MSLKNKIQNWFYLDEEEVHETPEPTQHRNQTAPRQQAMKEQSIPKPKRQQKNRKGNHQPMNEQNSPRIVSLQSAQKSAKVILSEPRIYDEAQDISEHLKNKRAVIVNLQRIERDQGIRIIDFLSGTVYALGGDIQRVGMDIFLCVPENVEVTGEITDYFE